MPSRSLLSWTVRKVHCSRCKTSEPTCGMLNQIALLLEHGDHLRHVSLELLLMEGNTAEGIPMMLRYVPPYIRLLGMN